MFSKTTFYIMLYVETPEGMLEKRVTLPNDVSYAYALNEFDQWVTVLTPGQLDATLLLMDSNFETLQSYDFESEQLTLHFPSAILNSMQ